MDEDGDLITMSDDADLNQATQRKNILRLTLFGGYLLYPSICASPRYAYGAVLACVHACACVCL